jgi:hypothetical protein
MLVIQLLRKLIRPKANRTTKAKRTLLNSGRGTVYCGKVGQSHTCIAACYKYCDYNEVQACPYIERQQHENAEQIRELITLTRPFFEEVDAENAAGKGNLIIPTGKDVLEWLYLQSTENSLSPESVRLVEKLEHILYVNS